MALLCTNFQKRRQVFKKLQNEKNLQNEPVYGPLPHPLSFILPGELLSQTEQPEEEGRGKGGGMVDIISLSPL